MSIAPESARLVAARTDLPFTRESLIKPAP